MSKQDPLHGVKDGRLRDLVKAARKPTAHPAQQQEAMSELRERLAGVPRRSRRPSPRTA